MAWVLPWASFLEARRAAASQRVVEQEVESQQVRQLETLDLSQHDLTEVGLDPFGDQVLPQNLESSPVVGQHADVRTVTLVARAGVGHRVQRDPFHPTSFTTTWGLTCCLGINVGQ